MTLTHPHTLPTVPQHDEYAPQTPPRGLVVLLQSRSDAASYYARFGRRLAADGYLVRVTGRAPTTPEEAAELWNAAVASEVPDGPVLAVAVDTAGGFLAAALSEKRLDVAPSGVVLAGAATPSSITDEGSPASLTDVTGRSACPVHRAVVEQAKADTGIMVSSTEVGITLPAHALGVPSLVIHGDADEISPLPRLRKAWTAGPVELRVVAGGLHDVLNDVHHRSVAAVIVSFAERLRLSPNATRIIQWDSL